MKTDRKKSFLFCFSLSVATGIILSFSFPPSGRWYIAFFAIIPLLFSAEEKSWRNFLSGLIAGFVFYAITLSWLYNVAGVVYLLLALYLSIYWGIFLYLIFVLPEKGRVFTSAFIWYLLEIVVSGLLTGFPWSLLGTSQWQNRYLLKVAGLSGVYGISFLVILANLVFFYVFRKRYIVSSLISVIIFIGVFSLPGDTIYRSVTHTGFLNVMIVQPNIDASLQENPYTILKTIELLTFENFPERRQDIVIWPEGIFPDDIEEYPDVLEGLKAISKSNDFYLMLGTFTGTEKGVYNSALMVKGGEVQVYRKNHLVPYGEFILGARFRVIKNIYENIAGYIPTITPGNALTIFTMDRDRKIAPLICFENIFPEMARDYVRAGGEVFIVITNDSWFGRSVGPYQHFAHNVIRAAETGRYFVQSSLSGVSGVVSPFGTIEDTVQQNGEKLFVKGVLNTSIPLFDGETLYSQVGDIPLFILSVIFMGVILCRRTG